MTQSRLMRLKLPLVTPFRIAHGSYTYRENLILQIKSRGETGYGEAPIVPYYGLSIEEAEKDLRKGLSEVLIEEALAGGDWNPEPIRAAFAYPVCRSAAESALLSLKAAIAETTVPALLGIRDSRPTPASSYTVAFDDDAHAMAERAAACGFTRIKVKAGIPGDLERVRAIRDRLPDAIIRVDANQGWKLEDAPEKIAALEELAVELIEEPVAARPSDLEALARSTSIPIVLDESVRDPDQLRRLLEEAPSVAGIVVKIAKNGGPSGSLELVRTAEAAGASVMLSCMVESSLGVASALSLAPLCAWCDLDAPLLIAEDPFVGFSYENQVPRMDGGGLIPGSDLVATLEGCDPFMEGR